MGFEGFLQQLEVLVKVAVPLVPVIVGLVEFAKLVGMPSDAAAVGLSISLGIGLTLAAQVAIFYPPSAPWILAVISGALIGMMATGLYTIGNRWFKRQ